MVIKPDIDLLLSKVDSKYTLCIVSARRARQINGMVHGVRDQALLTMQASQIASITSTKPLTLAMEEIASGDIGYERTAESYK
ncbi:MAG: DNA-directed RNA polymerase subunit omega [Actinomycetota bacterium]|nr:MAG: DNA-directed RNA polymerase omega [Actinomycetota bacterium]MDO8949692.1 DNA-directed RNA polymerase subunit omega [Actinomycetota bacterium]MDP3631474.1 DNA-directed RNA polymerase subunit omega [Actinomycetota bacterium]